MRLFSYLFRYKLQMCVLIALLVLSPFTTVFTGLWAGDLFDYAYAMDFEGVIRSFLLIFAAWIPRNLIRYWILQLKSLVTVSVRRDLKKDAFDAIIHVDLAYFEQFDSGEYLANLTNDVTIIDERYISEFLNVLESVFNILTTGAALFLIDRYLALTVVLTGALAVTVVLLESRATNRKNRAFVRQFAAFTQLLKEFFAAFPMIRNYAVERQFQRAFNDSNHETEETKFVADSELQFANAFSTSLVWLMDFTVVGLGIAEVIRGSLTVGMVYTAYLFVGNIGNPLQSVLNAANSMLSVKAVVEKFDRLKQRARAESEKESADRPLTGDISFQDVSLDLGEKPIFRSLSFTFEQGKKYLIIGKNGVGKSTLFKLLKRRISSYTGKILIGEQDIADVSYGQLAGYISYLNENCSVISDTVRNNITLYRDYREEDFQQAVKAAHLELDPERRIRDGGANISSGERRKIEIARALLSSPRVVIFDEVISTLDIESAYEIEKLALSLKDTTVLFVSHNFSGKNIGLYDEILLLDDARIVAHGSHEELLQSSELYRKLHGIRIG